MITKMTTVVQLAEIYISHETELLISMTNAQYRCKMKIIIVAYTLYKCTTENELTKNR